MHIIPFKPEHLETLSLQPAQMVFSQYFDPAYGPALVAGGPCFTGVHEGAIVGCSGVVKQWDNRAVAWALLSDHSGKHFPRIHKAVKRFLDTVDFKRVEAFVDYDFDQGHRWIRMLGFKPEGVMRCFTPEGKDAVLYARIK